MFHVGERPTDPLTIRVAPFTGDGETAFTTHVDGRDVVIAYRAEGDRHEVAVRGAPGEVELDVLGDVRVALATS